MLRWFRFGGAVLATAGLLCGSAAWSDDEGAGDTAQPAQLSKEEAAALNTKALRVALETAGDFLAAQKSFSFDADFSYDVVQRNGQTLEFGASRTVTVRRPDRARVEVVQRDGDEATMYFDGKRFSMDLITEDAYVSIEKPGSLDQVLDYLVDDLGVPSPLHDFVSSNFYDGIRDEIISGFLVDEERIDGVHCDHLALRASSVDVQLWLQVGEQPLPCRVIITYVNSVDSPQFTAQFSNWNLAPETPDKLFTFTPPDGAEQLSIQAVIRGARAETSGAQ